jgi:AcrR family transcriptional regulator
MPKIVNKKKKKEEIILAAIDAFYRCGVEKSSMKNIADSMGMGRSSLYSYFNNREEILNEMVLYTINKFNKTLQSKLFSKTMPVSEKIVRMFTNIFYEDEHVTKSVSVIIEYLVLIRREGKNHVHHLDKFTDHISKLFGTLLEQGVEEGCI